MKVIDPGHVYELAAIDGDLQQSIQFVKRLRGERNHPGTVNQELLRVLIDRIEFLDSEKPWALNGDILHHLRMALVLHEVRTLIRKVEKAELKPEAIHVSATDGHFIFEGLR